MSTSYHPLKQPFTRIDVDERRKIISVYADSYRVGWLTWKDDETHRLVMSMLFDTDVNVAHVSAAGHGHLRLSEPIGYHTADEVQVLDEYGHITTLGEVRKEVAEANK